MKVQCWFRAQRLAPKLENIVRTLMLLRDPFQGRLIKGDRSALKLSGFAEFSTKTD